MCEEGMEWNWPTFYYTLVFERLACVHNDALTEVGSASLLCGVMQFL